MIWPICSSIFVIPKYIMAIFKKFNKKTIENTLVIIFKESLYDNEYLP